VNGYALSLPIGVVVGTTHALKIHIACVAPIDHLTFYLGEHRVAIAESGGMPSGSNAKPSDRTRSGEALKLEGRSAVARRRW
jgi:hypothetical protein